MSRRIALLIYPDFQLLDAAGPIAAFEIAADYAPRSYALQVIAAWLETNSTSQTAKQ